MIRDKFRVNGVTYERISKARARGLFNSGEKVLFMPALAPNYELSFYSYIPLHNDGGSISFDSMVNAYEYYNEIEYTIFYKIV